MSKKIDVKQLGKALIDSTGGDLGKLKELGDKLRRIQELRKKLKALKGVN